MNKEMDRLNAIIQIQYHSCLVVHAHFFIFFLKRGYKFEIVDPSFLNNRADLKKKKSIYKARNLISHLNYLK